MVKAAVKEKASTTQSQEAYLKKYEALTERCGTGATANPARQENSIVQRGSSKMTFIEPVGIFKIIHLKSLEKALQISAL